MLQEQALGSALAGTGDPVEFNGTWTNQFGSTVVLVQAGDRLTGSYESTVSGGGGNAKGALQGFVDGDLISFIVHWEKFQVITTWVGQLDPKAAAPRALRFGSYRDWLPVQAGHSRAPARPAPVA